MSGHTRWTFFAYYPHDTLNLYKVASEPSEIPKFGPKKPYLHEKFDNPGYFEEKNEDNLVLCS